MEDPIVEEIHRYRAERAARFNYDISAMFEDIRRAERESGRTYVSFEPKRIKKPENIETASESR